MNVVFITSIGYPIQLSANAIKTELVALGLKDAGCKVSIIDYPRGTLGVNRIIEGISDNGLKYILLPQQSMIKCLFSNLRVIKKALKENKENKDNFAVIGVTYYHMFIALNLLCRLLGYKRVSLFHEWTQSFSRMSFPKKIEAFLNDNTFGYFLNGIFPISHFLEEKSKKFKKPTYMLPILSKYNRMVNTQSVKKHFTYCASIPYLIRNQILLQSFSIVHNKYPDISLELILNGNETDFKKIDEILVKYNIKDVTKIKIKIPQSELYEIYDTSIGLIVPLDPHNIQDVSRFSQKIAEYVESKRPIITSNVGEIPYYFKHNESAMIADYTAEDYAKCMIELIENPQKADAIGVNGYNIGNTHFNNTKHGINIKRFLKNL